MLNKQQAEWHVRMATYASVSVAAVLIAVKFYAWILTDSLSLQATLVDSLLDAAASILNLFAVREAQKPADDEHRFGHGKIEAIAAMGQSIFIFASAGWLLREAVHRFSDPQPIEQTGVGMIVMVVAIILTLILLTYQNYVVKHTHSTAILADSVHYRSDILINFSVIIALFAVKETHQYWIDLIIGGGIALYITYTAWYIAHHSFQILIDREFSTEDRQRIVDIAEGHPEVKGCHDLRTRSAGTQKFIQLHLEMDGALSLFEAHRIALEVTEKIHILFPRAEVLIHQDTSHDHDNLTREEL